MPRLTSHDAIAKARDDATRRVITDALRRGGTVSAAAEELHVARETLQRWCSRLGIDVLRVTGRGDQKRHT